MATRCGAEISIGGEEYWCEKTGHRNDGEPGPFHEARVSALDGFQPVTAIVRWPVRKKA